MLILSPNPKVWYSETHSSTQPTGFLVLLSAYKRPNFDAVNKQGIEEGPSKLWQIRRSDKVDFENKNVQSLVMISCVNQMQSMQ